MRTATAVFAAIVCAAFASAASAENDKDKGRGGDRGGPKSERGDHDNDRGHGRDKGEERSAPSPVFVVPHHQIVIVDRDRDRVCSYYRDEYAAGRCPPGLDRKNNGCMPPGLVNRGWVAGQYLPPQVVYHPMPPVLWQQLTPPPHGYEYVRVDQEILLLLIGTRLIAGSLGNLGSFGP